MAYTYLIGWSQHNKFYYGARWAKNSHPEDLWKTYFTSSKHVKSFREEHGEPDIVQVRKVFADVDKCKLYERKALEKLNVLHNDKWLNKNINGSFLPTGPQTKTHIENRVNSFIVNGRHKGIVAWTKESHPEAALKCKNALLGKPKSPQHIANMRFHENNSKKAICPHCSKEGQYTNMKRWHFDKCKLIP